MNKSLMSILAVCALSASCANGTQNENETSNPTDSLYPPVEQNPGNTNYKPAFEGQTRAPGVKTQSPYEARIIATGLKSPWGIAELPGNRFLITEKPGSMRIVSMDGSISEEISGIPEVDDDGQGGLLGVTLDPDFGSNRMVYWVFSQPLEGGNLTCVAKGRSADDVNCSVNEEVIYQAGPVDYGRFCHGGRISVDIVRWLFVLKGGDSGLAPRRMREVG